MRVNILVKIFVKNVFPDSLYKTLCLELTAICFKAELATLVRLEVLYFMESTLKSHARKDFVRLISLKVEVFLYSLLVSKMLHFSKKKKKASFLNHFAFVDPNLLSLEGPSHKKVFF